MLLDEWNEKYIDKTKSQKLIYYGQFETTEIFKGFTIAFYDDSDDYVFRKYDNILKILNVDEVEFLKELKKYKGIVANRINNPQHVQIVNHIFFSEYEDANVFLKKYINFLFKKHKEKIEPIIIANKLAGIK